MRLPQETQRIIANAPSPPPFTPPLPKCKGKARKQGGVRDRSRFLRRI